MGAPSKRARKIRQASEFDVARLAVDLMQQRNGRPTVNAWSLEQIYQAREQQMLGSFALPARMAEQMRTDDALFVAYDNRLAPRRCIPIALDAAAGARGRAVASEAQGSFGPGGIAIRPETETDINGCLVNHGVAFATCTWSPREDGTRVDVFVKYFPIEYVRYDALRQLYVARCDPSTVTEADIEAAKNLGAYGDQFLSGVEIPIVHGDGRWVVFKNHEVDAHRQGAAILSASIVWARHAFAARDWAKGSVAHGNAKIVGELPANVPMQDENGLSAEAAAFAELLRALCSADSPVGIRPAGSKTEFVTNNSSAWQVWSELVLNAEKAAARIYLGTDGTLGTQGGAPGVDISELFGVAKTKVRGDLECLQRGFDTGVIEPWTAINFGDSTLAPKRRYCLPNDEAEAVRAKTADRTAAFYNALKTAHDAGMRLAPEYVAQLAADYGVRVPIIVAPAPAPVAPAAAPPKA